jgi:hypothetical protein
LKKTRFFQAKNNFLFFIAKTPPSASCRPLFKQKGGLWAPASPEMAEI